MTRIAEGDKAAVFTMHDEFGNEIAAAVRRAARRLHVELDPDDLRGLTVEVALCLMDVAGGWDPNGGALPWVWADRRIAALVSAFVGQHTDSLDAEDAPQLEDEAAPGRVVTGETSDDELLKTLAQLSPTCRVFVEALEQVTTVRNRSVVLAFRVQKMMGDPSPAVTVGAEFGLRPDTVRQIVHRTKVAMRGLISADPRFGLLRELRWLT